MPSSNIFQQTKSWIWKEKGKDHHRGCKQPCRINPLTKASSKILEVQIGLNPTSTNHAQLHFITCNVIFKTLCMNAILQKDRSIILKGILLLLVCGYDILANVLLANKDFKNVFTQETYTIEKESLICIGLLNFLYIGFIAYMHHTEKQAIENASEHLTSVATTEPERTDSDNTRLLLENSPSSWNCWKSFINEIQLPIKFYFGVMAFFYGIMLGEGIGWQCQLPLSSLFYGAMMALTQAMCDLLKGEPINKNLIKYALVCGPAEGVAYYACLKWFPQLSFGVAYKTVAVAVSTTISIWAAGNLLFKAQETKTDNTDNVVTVNHSTN